MSSTSGYFIQWLRHGERSTTQRRQQRQQSWWTPTLQCTKVQELTDILDCWHQVKGKSQGVGKGGGSFSSSPCHLISSKPSLNPHTRTHLPILYDIIQESRNKLRGVVTKSKTRRVITPPSHDRQAAAYLPSQDMQRASVEGGTHNPLGRPPSLNENLSEARDINSNQRLP